MIFPNGTTEHPINKSGKNKILVSVWDFGAVHPQSERSQYLGSDHPAKMRPPLARAILQLYGESPILDPMAGIGTTLVEAMLLGMDAVGVEYERKFVDQANKNIEHIKKLFPNRNLGKAVCIKGDARDLSCIGQKVNSILTSPPYFNAIKKGDEGPCADSKRISYQERIRRFQGYSDSEGNIGNIPRFGSVVLSPPYFDSVSHSELPTKIHVGYHKWLKRGNKTINLAYSKDPQNIGNIPQFGSIIFSPPYCGVMDAKRHVGGIAARDQSLAKTAVYSKDESNLGNIRSYGQDAFGSILFSPPYADVIRENKEGPMATSTPSGWKSKKVEIDKGYSRNPGNIGNIPKFGSVIFSPPYADSKHHYRHGLKVLGENFKGRKAWEKNQAIKTSPENIENLRYTNNTHQFGSIIFSPPLGEANRGSGIAKKGYEGKHGKDEKLKDRCDRPLSQDKDNISNLLFGKTYLGEMFKVYRECFHVLKPRKFMVVVVKDIQRNWKTIPLGADTIKLCQLAGFDLHDIIINKMYFPSFWMVNLAIKSQSKENRGTEKFHVMKTHEYILVFRKPSK